MKRRKPLWHILPLLLLGGCLLHPAIHWRLIGWAKGEAFYQGRPTSYWRAECERWGGGITWHWNITLGYWHRVPSEWEKLLEGVSGSPSATTTKMPLVQGDPESVPVLMELLASSAKARLIAMEGLGLVGPLARDALPELRRIHGESEFAGFAWDVLVRIDPEAALEFLAEHP